jgi:hypothetical protein
MDQDFPPISIVTTTSTGGGSIRKKEKVKVNAPTILMKPPPGQKSSSPVPPNSFVGPGSGSRIVPGSVPRILIDSSSAEGPIAHTDSLKSLTGAGTGESNGQSSSPNSPVPGNEKKNDRQVDSALLSALRDKRERMALLRLEQTLIDFMNDKTCGYMEVGGPMNSIVIRGASGGSASPVELNNIGDGESNVQMNGASANTGTGPSAGLGGPGSRPVAAMNGNGFMPGPPENNTGGGGIAAAAGGMRQTSFQRLCLHRLADRFNIVREQGYNVNAMYNNATNSYTNNSNNNPGLIRLVKVKESRVPSLKLINLDLAEYDQAVPQDRTQGGFGVAGITDRLAGTKLQNGESSEKGSSRKSKKKKEKVKIMKRSTSNNHDSDKNDKNSSKNKRKSKKLSEKEKAYAEARARIFNSGADTPASSTSGNGNGANNSSGNIQKMVDGSDHSFPTNDAGNAEAQSSIPNSASASPNASQRASPLPSQDDLTQLSNGVDLSVIVKEEMKAKRGNLPAAATTGGRMSKVTWRNREQEATDPDFRRGHLIQQAPVHAQYMSHQYAVQGASPMNGHGHQGYHYIGMGDTQQQQQQQHQQQMYNHAAHPGGVYNTPNMSGGKYHVDPSWHANVRQQQQQQEISPTFSGNHSRQSNYQPLHGSNHEHDVPRRNFDANAPSTKKIVLSQDEFPSLS